MGKGRGPNSGNEASLMAWSKGPLFTTHCHFDQLVYISHSIPLLHTLPTVVERGRGVGDVVIKILLTPGAEPADQALTSA